MSDLRKWGLVLSISMRRHHLVLDHFGPMGRSTVAFLLIIVIVAPVEVSGTFVFAWATVILISVNKFSHIR
jgi:hypothetical protein